MPTPKLQTSRALKVIPNDTVPIPNPFPMASGAATSYIVDVLEDTTKDFVALGIRVGDVVYNLDTNASAIVIQDPISTAASELLLNSDIFPSGNEHYTIYQNSPLSGEPNAGAVLYVGAGGDVEVVTAGGDTVVFSQVPTGAFVPVNVVQVTFSGTSAQKIVALW